MSQTKDSVVDQYFTSVCVKLHYSAGRLWLLYAFQSSKPSSRKKNPPSQWAPHALQRLNAISIQECWNRVQILTLLSAPAGALQGSDRSPAATSVSHNHQHSHFNLLHVQYRVIVPVLYMMKLRLHPQTRASGEEETIGSRWSRG